MGVDALDFAVDIIPTALLDTLIVGSDGCGRIEQHQTEVMPGGSELIGNISQFSQPSVFVNPDNVRRRLALMNKTGQRVDWSNRQIAKYHGILNDDTTLITVRRNPDEPKPVAPVVDLALKIERAQVEAGEAAVVAHLKEQGLI